MALDVENAIQEAQREGRFSNLPGRGQPLQIDPSPDAVVNNLLKEAHVRPEWIEVGCRIDALQERTTRHWGQFRQQHASGWQRLTVQGQKQLPAAWRRWWHILWHGSENRLSGNRLHGHGDPISSFNRRWKVAIARYAALLHETNTQIRRFNRLVPQRELQRNIVPLRERLEEFASAFPQAVMHPDGGVAPLQVEVPAHLLNSENTANRSSSVMRAQHFLEATKR